MRDLTYYMSLHYPVTLIQRDHGGFFASHPDLSGCMAQGRTADEAIASLRESREMWIEARLDGGHDIPEPASEEFSGRFSLRVSPRLHGRLAQAAAHDGVSLNQLITNVLSEYLGERSATEGLREEVLALVGALAVNAPAANELAPAVMLGESSATEDETWNISGGAELIGATTKVVN